MEQLDWEAIGKMLKDLLENTQDELRRQRIKTTIWHTAFWLMTGAAFWKIHW